MLNLAIYLKTNRITHLDQMGFISVMRVILALEN